MKKYKIMKTTKLFLFTFLGMLLIISSCNDDDITDQPVAEPLLLDCDYQGLDRLVHQDSTLTLSDRGAGVDYIINCRASVRGDLIIEPGVTIQFGSSGALDVTGSLSAVGTNSNPIVFTGEDKVPGSWGFIAFDSDDVKNRLEYCTIEYGGAYRFSSNDDFGNVILISDARMEISNCTIRNGAEYGVKIPSASADLSEFSNNTITGCNIPVFIPSNHVGTITGGSYVGNETDAILISTGGFGNSATISENATWENLDVPYRVGKSIRVTSANLTISPGTTIEFENGNGISIGDSDAAGLICVGTPDNKILLTGVTKVAGSWSRLYFDDTSNPVNEVSYTIIEYGGSTDSDGVITMWGEPVVNVNNVEFKDIGTCALYAAPSTSSPNSNLTESNNTTDNVAGGYLCGD